MSSVTPSPNQPPQSSNSTFEFTQPMINLSNRLWGYTSVAGSIICFLVLAVIVAVSMNTQARRFLDRVSFRLTTVTLAANLVYAITNSVGGSFTGPTWSCSFTIFLLQLSLELSSFLTVCIALNLQLVLVHGLNGQRLEKYYFLASIILSLAITVPPYALNQYGWDPVVDDCWYANPDPKQQLAWQIGTQLIWTLLTIVAELVTATWVFIYMYRHSRRVANADNNVVSTFSQAPTSDRSRRSGAREDNQSYTTRLRRVVFRVWLYPVTSCIINSTNVALVLVGTIDGVQTAAEFEALLFSDFLYGARAIVYGVLAATDPALVRAVRYLYRRYRPASSSPRRLGFGTNTTVSISRPDSTVNSATHLRSRSQNNGGSQIFSAISSRSRASRKTKSRSRSKTQTRDRPPHPTQLSSLQVYVQSTSVQVDDIGTPVGEHTDYTSREREEKAVIGGDQTERGRKPMRSRSRDVEWAGDIDRTRDPDTSIPSPAAHIPLVSKAGTESSELPYHGPPFADTLWSPPPHLPPIPPQVYRVPDDGGEVFGLDLFPSRLDDGLDEPDDPDIDAKDQDVGSNSGHTQKANVASDVKHRDMLDRQRRKQAAREQAQELRARQEDFLRRI